MRFASAVLGVVAVAALALLSNRLDNSPEPEPIQVTVDAGEVRGQQLGRDASGRVTYAGHLFTGTQIDVSAGIRTEQAAYSMGLRSGLTERWYHDGTRSFRGTYHNGRRHGRIETWWPDGKRRSVSNYVDGVAHGIQREWYRSGALFKEVRLVTAGLVGGVMGEGKDEAI